MSEGCIWSLAGIQQGSTVCPGGLTQPFGPCGLGSAHTRSWEPKHFARKAEGRAVGLSGESSQGRQGAAVRREVGPAADGARVGPWKLQGLRFHSVAWSKLLNVSELPRAERRGERTCSTSAQDPGRAATCHIMAPARGGLAPGEPLQMSHCVCLPLPLLGPGPHPGTSHAL